jgi:pimeloyl-ACP methyl ester carboxylesterase
MKKQARIASTAAAFVTAGAVATVANGRARRSRRRRRGEEVAFGSVHSPALTLMSDDGVTLNVEIDECDEPGPTLVFLHGWVENLDLWHYQRLALRGRARMVFADFRSHGRSGRSYADNSSLDDLARDVEVVLEHTVPEGPIVLIGHSMGGMTIQKLAFRRPDLFGERVVGVVLMGTSSGRLMRSSPGVRRAVTLLRTGAPLLDWGRRFNSYSVIRRWALGPNAHPRHVDMANEMILKAPSHVLGDFYPNFVDMDLTAGLPALSRAKTIVIGGTADHMTPYKHSMRLAELIDGADLIELPNVGHMMMFEEHEVVTEAIEKMLESVRS